MKQHMITICCITSLVGCSQSLSDTWLPTKVTVPLARVPNTSAQAPSVINQSKPIPATQIKTSSDLINCDQTLDPQYRTAILSAINQIRSQSQQCGQRLYPATSPLQWSEKLQQSAIQHAHYISAQQVLSHYGPQGQSLKQRVKLTGYKGGGGESLASGQHSVKHVLDNWLGLSPGHCDNLMQEKYKHYALVCVRNPQTQRPYWVQHFGSHK